MIVFALAGCSGGGSGETASTTSPPTTTVTVTVPTTTTAPPRTTDTLRADIGTMDPDPSCLGAFRGAAAMDRGSVFQDRLYLAAADACPTVEDWLIALGRFPEVAGIRPSAPGAVERELEAVCAFKPESRLCEDATGRGFVDGKL